MDEIKAKPSRTKYEKTDLGRLISNGIGPEPQLGYEQGRVVSDVTFPSFHFSLEPSDDSHEQIPKERI